MAVSVVSSTNATSFQSTHVDVTFDATGADCLLVTSGESGNFSVNSALYNGSSFTSLWDLVDSGAVASAGLMILAPASGSHTLTVNYSTICDAAVEIVALSGVEQSAVANAHRTVATGTGGGSGQPTLGPTTQNGDFVYAGCVNNAATIIAGQTLITRDQDVFGNGFSVAAERTTAGAGSTTTMSFSATTGGTFWVEGACAIIAAAGGGGGGVRNPATLLLTGVQ